MARKYLDFQSGTLGAALTDADTTITFSSAPGFETLSGDDFYLLVLDADGTENGPEIVKLTAYTSGATTGTIERGVEGTTAVAHSSGEDWLHGPVASDMGPGLLSVTTYDPASQTVYSTTSATPSDVDATNLTITFVVPASGRVLIRLSAYADTASDSTGPQHRWNLRDGSGDVSGTSVCATRAENNSAARATTAVLLTGLTPGAELTYKWGYASATGTARIIIGGHDGLDGGPWGPATMEAWGA